MSPIIDLNNIPEGRIRTEQYRTRRERQSVLELNRMDVFIRSDGQLVKIKS